MQKLNDLVALAKKATPGEWVSDKADGVCAQSDTMNDGVYIAFTDGPEFEFNRDFIAAANPTSILAIAEAFRALEQRAEAAEAEAVRNLMGAHAWEKHARRATAERDVLQAKLAELDRQEPYGWLIGLPGLYPTFTLDYRNVEQAIAAGGYEITPIYTRPAPAINLAEPVAEGWQLVPVEPTEEMISAALKFPAQTRKQYAAMLAAAPEVE